ncbi:stage III sporulation protein AB [Clostridium sp. 'deep sea']|uniref:stage III sporulation protein AB n=1 Tax=Clostridium sp. 'deep sea' TaxID=2779445 RepID=UPI00189685FC|nr:stage III sporulation protein AB [Clostridium sp. 'deep sea']QOR35858.1 stage III sporulation protein AB [Clostridium sp. 'deep sea']
MILFAKILLAILVEYAVVMLCRTKVKFYRNRPKTLQQITYSLQNISNEMVFSNELLPSIVHKMARETIYPVKHLWQGVSKEILLGNAFEQSFERELINNQKLLSLSNEDIDCLRLLASQLGQSNLDNQLKILNITQNKIVENEKNQI